MYIHKDGNTEDLLINKYGELDRKWPRGFLDQGIADLEEIFRNKKLPEHEASG